MVELYVEDLKKSIKDLELDKELEKYIKHHLGKMLEAFGIILGILLLPLSGCSSYFEFSSEYGIGKNKPYRILGRGDSSSWIRLMRKVKYQASGEDSEALPPDEPCYQEQTQDNING